MPECETPFPPRCQGAALLTFDGGLHPQLEIAVPLFNDFWNRRELKPRIAGKFAHIPLTFEPCGIRCAVQE